MRISWFTYLCHVDGQYIVVQILFWRAFGSFPFFDNINHPAVNTFVFCEIFLQIASPDMVRWRFYLSLGLGSWSVFRPVWFWPRSYLVVLFPRGPTRHHGTEGPAQWRWEVPLCGQKLHQQPSGPGWLGRQEAGLGPFGEAGFRGSQHQGGERGWGDRGAGWEWEEGHCRQRWHPEDEPAQVLQGGGHGRADVPQRSLCAAQPAGEVLLRTHIREYPGEAGHFLLVSCTPEGVERLADVFGVQVRRLKFSLRDVACGVGSFRPGFPFTLPYLVLWHWTGYFTSWSLSFPICKMRAVTLPHVNEIHRSHAITWLRGLCSTDFSEVVPCSSTILEIKENS